MVERIELQTQKELDEFYISEDPWEYDKTPDDLKRRDELIYILPKQKYKRTLDLGCGNGFLTIHLPGESIIGCDISENAILYAKERANKKNRENIKFLQMNIFDCCPEKIGVFDLIVITGILYPQYIGSGNSIIRLIVDKLLHSNGILVCCHIDEWYNIRFPYVPLDTVIYPYRNFMHRLEVYKK